MSFLLGVNLDALLREHEMDEHKTDQPDCISSESDSWYHDALCSLCIGTEAGTEAGERTGTETGSGTEAEAEAGPEGRACRLV